MENTITMLGYFSYEKVDEKTLFCNFYPQLKLKDDNSPDASFIPEAEFPPGRIIVTDGRYPAELEGLRYNTPMLVHIRESSLENNTTGNEDNPNHTRYRIVTNGRDGKITVENPKQAGFYPLIDMRQLTEIKLKSGLTRIAIEKSELKAVLGVVRDGDPVDNKQPVSVILHDPESGLITRPIISRLETNKNGIAISERQTLLNPENTTCLPEDYTRIETLTWKSNPDDPWYGKEVVQYYIYQSEDGREAGLVKTEDGFFQLQYKDTKPAALSIPQAENTVSAGEAGYEPDPFRPDTPAAAAVARLQTFLYESGRDISQEDVLNYCLCFAQSFITVFSGAPGTGKTSLCRLLARGMGLKRSSRYTEVAVERGWTSIRDMIGYPDPFNRGEGDGIVPANPEICAAFRTMHEESISDSSMLPPWMILLDEANLSPLEYYWAQFLRLCALDEEQDERRILVSPREPWRLSPNLRFCATVNFDHTTEELSPRFLDRAWVITLDAPETDLLENHRPEPPAEVFSMSQIESFFLPQPGQTMPEESAVLWKQIRAAFAAEDVSLPLSPRNVRAVEDYCRAAAGFPERMSTPMGALDYALLQKILPTISGYGRRYTTLTERLIALSASNLPRTHRKLLRMRAEADRNAGFFQFFVR